MWFSGTPNAQEDTKDKLGTTVKSYANRYLEALGGNPLNMGASYPKQPQPQNNPATQPNTAIAGASPQGSTEAPKNPMANAISDMYAWDNTGAGAKPMFALMRSDNHAQFWGDVWSTTGAFRGNSAQVILSAQSGPVILRPYGADNSTYQAYAHTDGYFHINSHFTVDANSTYGCLLGLGMRGKNGIYGNYTANWHNWLYTNGYVYCLVDNTNVGAIQMVCDYRTKRNVMHDQYYGWHRQGILGGYRFLDCTAEHRG